MSSAKQDKTTQFTEMESEVLFQKLGQTWYVFSEINDELIYSALPDGIDPHSTRLELYSVIEEHMKKVSKVKPRRAKKTSEGIL